MKKSIIIIRKNSFIYNKEEYRFDEIDNIVHLLKPNIKIIILEEELYIKQFINNITKNNINKLVEYKINNEFPQNGDILYDYIYRKKSNIISIYYIRGAKRIEKLLDSASNLEIKPIQFIVKDVMRKFLKNNMFDCNVLVKLEEYYYYLSFKEGLFHYGVIEKEIDLVFDKIIQNDNINEIYVDNNVIYNLCFEDKFKIVKINIGDLINEKIYEKQRFYSRKVL
jgi:hypothetical protein